MDNDGQSASGTFLLEYLFHGTSEFEWQEERAGRLYLVSDPKDAQNYAYEAAARDELDGLPAKPVVYRIATKHLAGLLLEPDWGGYGVTATTTWQQSLERYGSLSMPDFPHSLKAKFERHLEQEECPDGAGMDDETKETHDEVSNLQQNAKDFKPLHDDTVSETNRGDCGNATSDAERDIIMKFLKGEMAEPAYTEAMNTQAAQ